jgi:hypothetical protein
MSWYDKAQSCFDGYWILKGGETHHCGFWGHGEYVVKHPELFQMESFIEDWENEGNSISTAGDEIVNAAIARGAIRVNLGRVVDVLVRSKDDFDTHYIEILRIAKKHGFREDQIFKSYRK